MGEFSVYRTAMQENFMKAMNARKLFEDAVDILHYHLPIFGPAHLIIKDTLETLSKGDWKKLRE